ncbi:MAG: type II secretion system protein [Phycisphaerae bacterium]|nr:type II secretion system protein [Phycisphaerae bacterium]
MASRKKNYKPIPGGRGFTLIELLVVMGTVAILIALVVPGLMGVRRQAKSLTDLEKIRNLGIGIQVYAGNFKDLPPVVFPPVFVNPSMNAPPVTVEVRGAKVAGAWFDNPIKYHLLLDPLPLRDEVLAAGATKKVPAVKTRDGLTPSLPHFFISDVFYADPEYWTRDKQVGPSQWRAQPLSSVQFPSSKGLMWQSKVFTAKGFPDGVAGCCTNGVKTAILWADLSATLEVMGKLRWGVPNGWHHGVAGATPPTVDAPPIYSTELGVLGIDR